MARFPERRADSIETLLRALAGRRLDISDVTDASGTIRADLTLPTWEDFVALAHDEIALSARHFPAVLRRQEQLLSTLAYSVQPARRPGIDDRLRWVRAQLLGVEPLVPESS